MGSVGDDSIQREGIADHRACAAQGMILCPTYRLALMDIVPPSPSCSERRMTGTKLGVLMATV